MKKTLKHILTVTYAMILVFSTIITAFAHSGRTDSSGGHKDNKNKSGLGSYHYHCGGYPAHLHSGGYCPYRDVLPSGVTMNAGKTTLGIGETTSISASVYPSNSVNTSVTWSCSDNSVVSVSNGTITAKGYGTAAITATAFNGVQNTIYITVKEITAERVTVSGLPKSTPFYIGETLTLAAAISPENVDNPSIIWSSSNEEIATVSTDGEVTLNAEGAVEILATASNGVVGKVAINVQEKYVETVEIEEDEIELLLGDEYTIAVLVSPDDATYPELTWEIDDSEIASISEDGILTALACGEAIITATSTNNISDTVVVKVDEIKATSLDIEAPATIFLGSSASLSPKFSPIDTTDQNITWAVDDTSIANITDEGVVTANAIGTVTITATQKDVSATCTIEILPIVVEEIRITASTEEDISKDDIITFSAEVFPENATYPDITWSVSNPEIATITSDGTLTALKSGTVTVIATAGDGFTAEYEVTVSSPVLSTTLGIVAATGIGVGAVAATKRKKKE